MSNFRIRTAATLCAVAMGALTAAVPASASPGFQVNAGPFAAQAEQVGLTAAQATELQSKVNRYLNELGGTQVSINKIQLDGAALTVTLPGEAAARDLTAGSPTGKTAAGTVNPAILSCANYYFCLFQYPTYNGDRLSFGACNQDDYIPWASDGSFINNQINGRQATFKDRNHHVNGYSPPAYSALSYYPWNDKYYVQPC